MTALDIKPRKIGPRLDIGDTRTCDICSAGSGRFRVTILDHPAGLVCQRCAKKWKTLWQEALV